MTDTQWPRFEVFQQEVEDQPHLNTNSVHAPDAEMALLNARDVFVRRPNCISLWVVPADKIFSKTAQELVDPTWEGAPGTEKKAGAAEPYYVFQKLRHQGRQSYAGSIEASSPEAALWQAMALYAHKMPLVWWVFPARFVTKSEAEDIASMFAPAVDKTFRDQSEYHTVAMMHEIKKKAK